MMNKKQFYENVSEIAKRNGINEIIVNDTFGYICVDQPKSHEEAMKIANFWDDTLKQTKDYVKKIEFVYQEKEKEIPLSRGKKFLKDLGFKIKPEIEEGEIKYESFKPELIRDVNSKDSLVNCILEKDTWSRLNDLSKNTETFSVPFVMMPENLCYRINIPLECITEVEYKSLEEDLK